MHLMCIPVGSSRTTVWDDPSAAAKFKVETKFGGGCSGIPKQPPLVPIGYKHIDQTG